MAEAVEKPDSGGPANDDGKRVGLSGVSPFTVPPSGEDVPEEGAPGSGGGARQKRTKLHEIVNELWGYGQIDDYVYGEIIKYANPDTAKKTENGFEIMLLNGRKINWALVQEEGQAPHEEIYGTRDGFNEEDAAAMVVLARLRGWNSISVHGTTTERELLWLAVQRQNLLEQAAFEKLQEEGHIPTVDQQGNPITFTPSYVDNFTPMTDSELFHRWKQEEAAFKALHPPAAPPAKSAAEPEAEADALGSKFQAAAEPPAAEADAAPESEGKVAPELPEKREKPASAHKHKRGHGRQSRTPHKKGHRPH